MQTNLKTDSFCSTNQNADWFYYTFQPGQYYNTYAIGEIAVNANGGGPGSYVRPQLIDTDSFLSGRDDILSKCVPPVPDLGSINQEPLMIQPEDATQMLLPKWTKQLTSQNNLSAIDFNRWVPGLSFDPQTPRYVIEDMSNDGRTGLNTRNFVRSSWSNQNNSPYYDPNFCRLTLDPSRACGPWCAEVNGYMPNVTADVPGLPPGVGGQHYPFKGITSQQMHAVGSSACGDQYFGGTNFDQGSCPPAAPAQVFGSDRPPARAGN